MEGKQELARLEATSLKEAISEVIVNEYEVERKNLKYLDNIISRTQ